MSFWQFLNHWWNLPSLVMLGLVGVFFCLQLFGLFTGNDAEADAEGGPDHEVDAELDHDLDADADADADHDVDADHDADADHEGGSALHGLAAFLGVGRVPFLVVWLTLFIFAGFTGLFLNRVLFAGAGGRYPVWGFPLSLFTSLLVGAFATRVTAKQVAKIVDVGGKGSTRRRELEGRFGVVASPTCDAEFGEVRVKDEQGRELLVHGKLLDGPALRQGDKVLLVELDVRSGLYVVEKFDDAPALGAGKKVR